MISGRTENNNSIFRSKLLSLPKTHRDILDFYYDAWLDGRKITNYDRRYLATRFKCTENHLSEIFTSLEKDGWMGGIQRGQRFKERWISDKAFYELDDLHRHQIRHQEPSIPYNNLSDQECDQIKISKETQNCEQITMEQELEIFLAKENVPHNDRKIIKQAIKNAPIGPVKRKFLIERVIKRGFKSLIKNVKSYFLTTIRREIQEFKNFIKYLKAQNTKMMPFHDYDMSNLDNLGCFI